VDYHVFKQPIQVTVKFMNNYPMHKSVETRKIKNYQIYVWVVDNIVQAIRPDISQGETPEVPKYERHRKPGSTDEVDFWTSREVREVVQSHLNYVVADTKKWEQSATYFIDTHAATAAFVKNSGLGMRKLP